MTEETPYNDVVRRLIAVGKLEVFDSLPTLFTAPEQNAHPRLAGGAQPWQSIITTLSSEDVVALIKSLTVAEGVFPGWSAGSVSPVIRLFWRLFELDPRWADLTAGWVVEHTRNPYLPFGSSVTGGAKTVAEFRHYQAEYQRRAERNIQAERERQSVTQEDKRAREAEKATHDLYNSVRRKDERAVEALLRKGAKVSEACREGKSVLALAREQGDQRIIEMLEAASSGS